MSTNIITSDSPSNTLYSELDNSVNFVIPQETGSLEARYVRRNDDYFIAYLSSQTGCNQGCRMCHLTATNQRKFTDTSINQYTQQAKLVLDHYKTQLPAVNKLHYNYMARGEPLANPTLLQHNDVIFDNLNQLAHTENLTSIKHIVSTIMPKTMLDTSLIDTFSGAILPEIYYSLYSLDESFRRKWLPNAIDPILALTQLVQWQQRTGKTPKIHYAFIKGENDTEQQVIDICNLVNNLQLNVNINVVRYNPYSPRYGQESELVNIENNMRVFESLLVGSKIKLITKVGFDVKASCGMFIGGNRG